ncbi:MAG: hypothetical protein PWP07_606 [Epulopiscium sp.]|uniref:Uncharacterized protein n=1 Tax=Defluviitalea raffinosedens TaxID=1450156 RepID=A0A7C8LUA9_9FIRM|nr:hypothetical protein [Defluviitalea raffinosedens]MBZ4668343.1 hypothetical protein [Defluviitaleaceae bacterium]MDK2787381.1 hypothetical protein [Candidatus Epulonipiscium sp.]KAE9636222.1 hypothetical protein GND95_03635 [Defluviitalea raffinosedens]MBM7684918.1 hypothetical protein [Defluviitalea raffinosedens]HHW66201.1 hypothetical protein [Candidatus Epulonipiscium sp.]
MIDEEKIKLMSKLAIYEKNHGNLDGKINGYFKSDYVYIQNWWTRLSVTIAGFLIIGLILFYKIFVEKVDLFSIDYKAYGMWLGGIIVVLLVVYSVLSSYVHEKRYKASEKRIRKYLQMLRQLEELKLSSQQEEVKKETYESNLPNTRDDHQLL